MLTIYYSVIEIYHFVIKLVAFSVIFFKAVQEFLGIYLSFFLILKILVSPFGFDNTVFFALQILYLLQAS